MRPEDNRLRLSCKSEFLQALWLLWLKGKAVIPHGLRATLATVRG
jgi:hypothetical protein